MLIRVNNQNIVSGHKRQLRSAHTHKHSAINNLKKIITPTNLVTLVGTIGLTTLLHSLLNKLHDHNQTSPNSSHQDSVNWSDLASYAIQIPASIFIWSVLAAFVPEIKFNARQRPSLEFRPTELYKKHQGNLGKVFAGGARGFGKIWKFVLAITGLYTLIQGLTDYAKNHIEPDNKLAKYTLTLSSFVLKILTLFYADALINKKDLNIVAFWQSLSEACACCGNPRLVCIQMAPIFVDLWQGISGQGLSGREHSLVQHISTPSS